MDKELETKRFVGTISYENIETGVWSVSDGKTKYRINNIPTDMKKENLKVALKIKEVEGEMSIFMTGRSINIIEFKIIDD